MMCCFRFLYQQQCSSVKEKFRVKRKDIGKVLLSAVSVVLLCVVTVGSGFAAGSTVKIGTISVPEILAQSTAGQEAKRQMEGKYVELQTKIQQAQEKQDALRAEIEKKNSIWSEEVQQEKTRDLLKMEQEFKLMQDDAQFEFQKLNKKMYEPILKELHEVIVDIGKKEGFTLIFDNSLKGLDSRSGLLYADEALDINDMIVKELEKRMAAKKDAK